MFKKNSSTPALPGQSAGRANENQILRDLAEDYMKDLKWRRIFKFTVLALVVIYFLSIYMLANSVGGVSASRPHTAVVNLNGVIGIDLGATSDQINGSLRSAFESEQSKGVVLRINSPGGTPVQSAEINAEISRLREKYPQKPMHVVINELCASGGYYVAVAADKIFANPSSIVGSIGVRMDSFGFVDAIEKLGVERRTLTAGANKALLDPFLPTNQGQVAHLKSMLDDVHQQFIDAVTSGRGDKIEASQDLFTGLVWSGSQARELGLIDDFGSLDFVASEIIGESNVVDYSFQPNFFDQFSRDFGVSVGKGIAQTLGFGLQMQ
ncbi:MAG: signal peptide peptidase SppA [Pseudomonadota bacterium]